MGQDEKPAIGHNAEIRKIHNGAKYANHDDFVLEKSIFNNIFEKDIRRVFIYKKVERLAKAVHLVLPAFAESVSLKNRIDAVAVGLVDAALLPPTAARAPLSRELLALSSVLSIAHASGLLSSMNAELIGHEARLLLQEIASYEEPRLLFDETLTLADIARQANKKELPLSTHGARNVRASARVAAAKAMAARARVKDTVSDIHVKDRREAILSVIRNKKTASIKDISTLVRGISEKTIQRELATLITIGILRKQGERRWSIYSIA